MQGFLAKAFVCCRPAGQAQLGQPRTAMRMCLVALIAFSACVELVSADGYLVGIGQADITGPAADVNLMGYAMPLQIARGIHTRLYARAYVFADTADPRKRFVNVVSDACMASQLVSMRVISTLQAEYGGLYTAANVALSGTHTHASPAGFLQYLLYSITSLGFVEQSFDALVEGITEAIRLAHADLQPADVSWASGELNDANINRSPGAYLRNPAEERALYTSDVDKTMDLLRIKYPQHQAAAQQQPAGTSGAINASPGLDRGRGLISWFAVHCTSMNNTNMFISSDNKGVAALLVEKTMRSKATSQQAAPSSTPSSTTARSHDSRAAATSSGSGVYWRLLQWLHSKFVHWLWGPAVSGSVSVSESVPASAPVQPGIPQGFTAAFAQSAVGDSSPNILGAFCLDTGQPCEMHSSTCDGRTELCHGRGPAWPDDTASTAIIATRQANKALELWQQLGIRVQGDVDYRHKYINMSNLQVYSSKWTQSGVTCPPAMGFSFAAGTTDGPGAFDFTQGDTKGNPFWRLIRDVLSPPSPEQSACHAPKPILLNTGSMRIPYLWQPDVTELSVIRLGNFVIVTLPGEPTTMAGRRVRMAVADTVGSAWGENLKVVVSGLTGTYSSYITTFEEYQEQRYEGASTIYGPHTLDAYIQTALELVQAMLSGEAVSSDVAPPDLKKQQISLLAPVVADAVPRGAQFGDVVQQPLHQQYSPGQVVEAVFRSGCPRNNLRRNSTFLAVERAGPDGLWVTVATDADWETHFLWERHWLLSEQSFATTRWAIPTKTLPGLYRLTHFGDHKNLFGRPIPFKGSSNPFIVAAPQNPVTHQQARQQGGVSDRSKPTARTDVCIDDPIAVLVNSRLCQGLQATSPGPGQQPCHPSRQERWAALQRQHEVGLQVRARFGHQGYEAWWRARPTTHQAPL